MGGSDHFLPGLAWKGPGKRRRAACGSSWPGERPRRLAGCVAAPGASLSHGGGAAAGGSAGAVPRPSSHGGLPFQAWHANGVVGTCPTTFKWIRGLNVKRRALSRKHGEVTGWPSGAVWGVQTPHPVPGAQVARVPAWSRLRDTLATPARHLIPCVSRTKWLLDSNGISCALESLISDSKYERPARWLAESYRGLT